MKAAVYLIVLLLLTSICLTLFDKKSTNTLPKYAHLFTAYYSKDATSEMLKRDTDILKPLVDKYDMYVSTHLKEKATKSKIWNMLMDSLANNERLDNAYHIKKPNKNQVSKEVIVQNLADLLVTVKLLIASKDDISKSFEVMKETLQNLAWTSKKVEDKTVITFHSSDGFTEEAVNVLFLKTASLRKSSQGIDINEEPYSVNLVEIIDEIVWQCVLRNCVKREQIRKQGPKKYREELAYKDTEEQYIALYTARVKVLLYLALFQRLSGNKKELTTTKSKLEQTVKGEKKHSGFKCTKKTAVIGSLIALGLASVSLYNYKFPRPNMTATPPSKTAFTTQGWSDIFDGFFILVYLALILVAAGGAYYYCYYKSNSDDENYGDNEGDEVDEKGKIILKDKKSGVVESKKQAKNSAVDSTILEKGKLKHERTFSSVFSLNKSADLKKLKLFSSTMENQKMKPLKQVKRKKVTAGNEQQQTDSTIITTRDVQKEELVPAIRVKAKGKVKQENLMKKKKKQPFPQQPHLPLPKASRLASSVATNNVDARAAASSSVSEVKKGKRPTKMRTLSSLNPSSEEDVGESPKIYPQETLSLSPEECDGGKDGVVNQGAWSNVARGMVTNSPPLPSTSASSAAASSAAAAAEPAPTSAFKHPVSPVTDSSTSSEVDSSPQ